MRRRPLRRSGLSSCPSLVLQYVTDTLYGRRWRTTFYQDPRREESTYDMRTEDGYKELYAELRGYEEKELDIVMDGYR